MIARRPDRVYVDANELFLFTVMDVILGLAEDLVLDLVWSDELLDEWQRVIVREGKRTPESAASVAEAIRTFFAAGRVDPNFYRPSIAATPGRDVDDRVHTAAAIAAGASVLLTRNRRDFPIDHLADNGVQVLSADEYLDGLLVRRPATVLGALRRIAGENVRRPLRAGSTGRSGQRHGEAPAHAARRAGRRDPRPPSGRCRRCSCCRQ